MEFPHGLCKFFAPIASRPPYFQHTQAVFDVDAETTRAACDRVKTLIRGPGNANLTPDMGVGGLAYLMKEILSIKMDDTLLSDTILSILDNARNANINTTKLPELKRMLQARQNRKQTREIFALYPELHMLYCEDESQDEIFSSLSKYRMILYDYDRDFAHFSVSRCIRTAREVITCENAAEKVVRIPPQQNTLNFNVYRTAFVVANDSKIYFPCIQDMTSFAFHDVRKVQWACIDTRNRLTVLDRKCTHEDMCRIKVHLAVSIQLGRKNNPVDETPLLLSPVSRLFIHGALEVFRKYPASQVATRNRARGNQRACVQFDVAMLHCVALAVFHEILSSQNQDSLFSTSEENFFLRHVWCILLAKLKSIDAMDVRSLFYTTRKPTDFLFLSRHVHAHVAMLYRICCKKRPLEPQFAAWRLQKTTYEKNIQALLVFIKPIIECSARSLPSLLTESILMMRKKKSIVRDICKKQPYVFLISFACKFMQEAGIRPVVRLELSQQVKDVQIFLKDVHVSQYYMALRHS